MNLVEVALPTPLRSTFTYQHNLQENLIGKRVIVDFGRRKLCLLYTSPSPRDLSTSRMPSSA